MLRRLPSGDLERKVISAAKRYSGLIVEKAIEAGLRPPEIKPFTLRFSATIMVALQQAATTRNMTPEDLAEDIIRGNG